MCYEEANKFPQFNVTIDQIPCHTGCCQALLRLRRGASDLMVVHQLALNPLELKSMTRWQPAMRSGWVLDAGANLGVFSSLLCLLHPTLRIVVVELDPANFKMLQLNTAHCKHIVLVHAALWGSSTFLSVRRGPDSGPPEWGYQAVEDGKGQQRAVTVLELMKEHGIASLQLAKVDIEGAEVEALSSPSAPDWLRRTNEVWIEIHERLRPGTEAIVHRALKQANFTLLHNLDKTSWMRTQ